VAYVTVPEHMRFCLTAPVATMVCVGSELELHGNDAFWAFVGAPAVLGRPARDVFGEQWAVLAPLVERAPAVAHGVRFAFEGVEREATVIVTRDGDAVACTFVESPSVQNSDELLALIAHELRSPLTPVMTTLEVMRRRGSTEDLTALERPLRQLARRLDDVLEYSRMVGGRLVLDRQRVELARIVDRALELSAGFGDRILVSVPRSGIVLLADIERLANAFSHLFVDAAEHGTSRVTIEATNAGERVRLTVRCDDSIPIEGLGHAITRTLIEMHGGSLAMTLHTLTIELPADAQAVVRPAEHVRQRARKRILVVEDNDDTARSLKTALELLGYEVAIAHDGPVALTVARAFRPDAALLDIGLPVMDGYELAKRLRALATERMLPVVAVTAYGTESYRQRSVDAGFADHLVKPADLAQLERVLDTVLEG
jgi:CheY-like chemotaxis protein